MMAYCAMCGTRIPNDQGSSTCSMCYGDVGHGRDGYYEDVMREAQQESEQQQCEQEDPADA